MEIEENTSAGSPEFNSKTNGGLSSSAKDHLIKDSTAEFSIPLVSKILIPLSASVNVEFPQSLLNRRQVDSSVRIFFVETILSRRD